MEVALRRLQPACVLCGAADDLSTDHVRPLARGGALEPGNAVRLCRGCNGHKGARTGRRLPPGWADILTAAAAAFRRHWQTRETES
jgi:5-methylcytosine-specific restriction endonuclease McrA